MAPVAPQSRSSGGSVNVDQPLSPLDEEVDRRVGAGTSSRSASSGGAVINIDARGAIMGSSREQVAQGLRELLEDGRRASGNLGI